MDDAPDPAAPAVRGSPTAGSLPLQTATPTDAGSHDAAPSSMDSTSSLLYLAAAIAGFAGLMGATWYQDGAPHWRAWLGGGSLMVLAGAFAATAYGMRRRRAWTWPLAVGLAGVGFVVTLEQSIIAIVLLVSSRVAKDAGAYGLPPDTPLMVLLALAFGATLRYLLKPATKLRFGRT
jgi:hypothetical protein